MNCSVERFLKYDCTKYSSGSHFLFIVGLLQRELEQLEVFVLYSFRLLHPFSRFTEEEINVF